jgi:hypothetical protein
VHRREVYFKFIEKIESLRILENYARRALSWCIECTKGTLLSLKIGEVSQEDLHRVTGHPAGLERSA